MLASLALAALVASCSQSAPTIECQGPGVLTLRDCDRAIEAATEALPHGHPSFTLISMSPGCPPRKLCPATLARTHILVVFESDDGQKFHVLVDRADWHADFVPTPGPGSVE